MVVQNYKSKNSIESDIFLNVPTDIDMNMMTNKSSNRKIVKCDIFMLCKYVIGTLFLSLLILNVIFLFLIINKNSTINRLHDQVNALKEDVDMLKYRFFDDSLLKEIADFERESYADESQSQPDEFDDIVEDDEDEDFSDYEVKSRPRTKREVLAATLDGVPIITESYAEQKRRNATTFSKGTASEGLRLYESLGKNTPAPAHKRTLHTGGWTARTYVNHGRSSSVRVRPTPIVSRTSRVMHTDEDKSKAFRKVVKKSLVKSSNSNINLQEHVESVHVTVLPPSRRHGHRHGKGRRNGGSTTASLVETAEVVGAHYYANTSHLAGKHHLYRGNGHFAHPQGLYVDWQPSEWVATTALQLQQGEVLVRESGLYLVYAQIYYVDDHDTNGFQIMRNRVELAQCTTMTYSEVKLVKPNTCWTSTLAALEDGDRVFVRDTNTHRYAQLAHAKSFFGLYKLADLNHRPANTHTIK